MAIFHLRRPHRLLRLAVAATALTMVGLAGAAPAVHAQVPAPVVHSAQLAQPASSPVAESADVVDVTPAPAGGGIRTVAQSIPDQYIVVLTDSTARDAVDTVAAELTRAHGGSTTYVYQHALKGFAMQLPAPAATALSRDPRVAYVQEVAQYTLSDQVPVPMGWPKQKPAPWGLDRVDQRNLALDTSYEYRTSAGNVTAYVIDTGIRTTHLDFDGRATTAFDAFPNDGSKGRDCSGHGTHVAGTLGGRTYGVAKKVQLRAVRVFDCKGAATTTSVLAGVDWVTANAARPAVANMSLGCACIDLALNQAVENSIASGVTYVVAAGNDGKDASGYSPALVAEAITVGASDQTDKRASYSNFGPVLDVFAPGTAIKSAGISNDTAEAIMNGTSMAAPHAAGYAALYLSFHPTTAPANVSYALVANATTGNLSGIGAGSPNRLLHTLFEPFDTAPSTEG
jgi:subtilisin family serine protease